MYDYKAFVAAISFRKRAILRGYPRDPHVYQLKGHIRGFQCEMPFPKPQRGEIFIETIIPKNQSSSGAICEIQCFNSFIKHVAPYGAKDCYLFVSYKHSTPIGVKSLKLIHMGVSGVSPMCINLRDT